MTVSEAVGGGYWVVWDAFGRLIARGSKAMCERVAAGLPVTGSQGSLF